MKSRNFKLITGSYIICALLLVGVILFQIYIYSFNSKQMSDGKYIDEEMAKIIVSTSIQECLEKYHKQKNRSVRSAPSSDMESQQLLSNESVGNLNQTVSEITHLALNNTFTGNLSETTIAHQMPTNLVNSSDVRSTLQINTTNTPESTLLNATLAATTDKISFSSLKPFVNASVEPSKLANNSGNGITLVEITTTGPLTEIAKKKTTVPVSSLATTTVSIETSIHSNVSKSSSTKSNTIWTSTKSTTLATATNTNVSNTRNHVVVNRVTTPTLNNFDKSTESSRNTRFQKMLSTSSLASTTRHYLSDSSSPTISSKTIPTTSARPTTIQSSTSTTNSHTETVTLGVFEKSSTVKIEYKKPLDSADRSENKMTGTECKGEGCIKASFTATTTVKTTTQLSTTTASLNTSPTPAVQQLERNTVGAILTLVFKLDHNNKSVSIDNFHRNIYQVTMLVCHYLCTEYCTPDTMEKLTHQVEVLQRKVFLSYFVQTNDFCPKTSITKESIMHILFDQKFRDFIHRLMPSIPLAAIYSSHSLIYIEPRLNSTSQDANFTFFTGPDWYSLLILVVYCAGISVNCYLAHRLVKSELIARKLGNVGNFIRRSARFSQVARWLNGRSGSFSPGDGSAARDLPRIGAFTHGRADIARGNIELDQFQNSDKMQKLLNDAEVRACIVGGVTPANGDTSSGHHENRSEHTRF